MRFNRFMTIKPRERAMKWFRLFIRTSNRCNHLSICPGGRAKRTGVACDSVAAFTATAAADPESAIAYWGIAISHRPNPLVLPLSAAVLKNGLAAVEKGKAVGAKTERERDWLAAIELYYKDYDKVDQTARGLAYEKAMERLMQKYPDDREAAIFYALALNETALPSDKTYANQLKAGAILEQALLSQPDHAACPPYFCSSSISGYSTKAARPTC
jgi:hypothetical protein